MSPFFPLRDRFGGKLKRVRSNYDSFLAEDREKDDKERKRRQAAEAEVEAERKRQAAKRLDQQRKGDPKSGHGAGGGTSA